MAEKKKELDILLERKQKADAMYSADASKIPLNQMKTYLSITERIHVLEDIKFLINTSPESMNPEKYQEHAKYVFNYLHSLSFSENLREFCKKNEQNFNSFVPGNISDYKKNISSILIEFLKVWKLEKNYK
jgi:hypothetical protein